MNRIWRTLGAAIALALAALACATSSPTPAPTPSLAAAIPTPTPTVVAVETPAPSPTSTPMPPPTATSTPTATPSPTPTPTVTPTPVPQPAFQDIPRPPRRDLLELVARLKLKSPTPLPPLERRDTLDTLGHVETFRVMDLQAVRPFTVRAELRYVSPNVYLYYQEGAPVSQRVLESSAAELEERIIPAVRRFINPKWEPGGGVDSRITILHARFGGASGYFNSMDLYPTEVYPLSNQRPMVYISLSSVTPGSSRYFAVLAHELQHAAHHRADPHEESWIQEGASELLAELAGYPVNLFTFFLSRPDIQLTDWNDEPAGSGPHYGAAHLFLKFIGARYGYERVPELVAARETGIDGVEAFLKAAGAQGGFDSLFRDWTIANYLNAPPGTRFGYPSGSFRVALAGMASEPGSYPGQVAQYAADYIQIGPADSDLRVIFQGPTKARLIPAEPPSGSHVWWSNRGDSIGSSLTRRFDLSRASTATLKFKLWYDIERHFDYAYVEASRDGKTWEVLRGAHSTAENPIQQALGPAYTGKSGGAARPRWVEESMDLSAYAGAEVWVRFEYVTDEGVNHNGLALDDIAIPEIGFSDDAERDGGWEAKGFVRTDNAVPQRFFVSLIVMDGEPEALELLLDRTNRAEALVPAGRRGVLVVGAAAPLTTEPAAYTYIVQATRPGLSQ